MQGLEIVNIDPFALTLAEFSQQTFRLLLFAQALLQLVQTHTQRLNLFRLMTLIDAVTQQLAGHFPRLATRQRAVNSRHQLVSLLKLAVGGLRHAHLLVEVEQLLGRFLLFSLEGFQPLIGALRGQIR